MDAIQDSITQLQKMFTQRMDIYQSELQAAAPSASIANLTSEFSSFRLFIMTALRNLQDQVGLLMHQVDNMEMRSRRKILLLHGLPEEKNEDTVQVLVKTFVDRLRLSSFSDKDISRCHRMGHTSSDKPRPILFKLCELEVKNKIWQAKTCLKGTGITLSEFLTKTRHEAFMAARRRYGISNCWTREGFVFVLGSGGVRHRISSVIELDKIVEPTVSKSKTTTAVREPAGASKSRRTGTAGKR